MRLPLVVFVVFAAVSGGSHAIAIDNGLVGSPRITCGREEITVAISTENAFAGNVYTKGFFESAKCRLKGNATSSKLNFQIPLTGECGLRRRRTVNPRGMTMDATLVVMFHRIFLTKVDKAFHIKCVYLEADKEVTQTLQVSMLPTTDLPSSGGRSELADDSTMPTCKYEVMKDDEYGKPLRFGLIGEHVYHKWTCEGENAEKYCMTVHSCVVDDGQGLGQQLIDERGCALDRYLLNNLDYLGPLAAGQKSHVFKFADRPTVFFSCQIKLQIKDDAGEECVRSADLCEPLDESSEPREVTVKLPRRDGNSDTIEHDFPRPSEDFEETTPTFFARKKTRVASRVRLARNPEDSVGFNIDVVTPSVDVIDIPEHSFTPETLSSMDVTRQLLIDSPDANRICATRREFFVFLVFLLLLFIASSLISIAVYARRRQFAPRAHYPNFLANILKCDA